MKLQSDHGLRLLLINAKDIEHTEMLFLDL